MPYDSRRSPRSSQICGKLARNRRTTPLFDTQAFTGNLETGYLRAWQRHVGDGLPPADIRVD